MKAPTTTMSPPKRQRAAEIAGRRDQHRHDDGEPAVAGGDPGQLRHRTGQICHRTDDAIDIAVELPALVVFAAVERDAFRALAGANQREAQFRLA